MYLPLERAVCEDPHPWGASWAASLPGWIGGVEPWLSAAPRSSGSPGTGWEGRERPGREGRGWEVRGKRICFRGEEGIEVSFWPVSIILNVHVTFIHVDFIQIKNPFVILKFISSNSFRKITISDFNIYLYLISLHECDQIWLLCVCIFALDK